MDELLSATSHIDRPDFAAIMEGEEDTRELLDMFIEDTEEELSGMRNAFSTGDYERLGHIIHKAAPLWGMIRIDIPLRELEKSGLSICEVADSNSSIEKGLCRQPAKPAFLKRSCLSSACAVTASTGSVFVCPMLLPRSRASTPFPSISGIRISVSTRS